MKIAFGGQIGTYHKTIGLPCQDYVNGLSGDEISVVALADGAGSYDVSEKAAKIIVDTAINTFIYDFDYWFSKDDDTFKTDLIEYLTKAVEDEDPDLIAKATLLLVAATKDGRDIIVHIGDGFIIGIDYENDIYTISAPENGDEPNQTFFLSDAWAKDHLRIKLIEESDNMGFLLCSDGSSEALVDRINMGYAKAIYKLFQSLKLMTGQQVSEMIETNLDQLFRSHTMDDMSIGILLR